MDVRRSTRQPDFDARVNVLGGLNVVQLGIRVGTRRIIYASTGGAVYGNPTALPASESHPTQPVSEYGASKLAFEHYLSVYGNRGQIEYAALRFPNVYGPRQRADGEAGVIAIFGGQMLRRDKVTIFDLRSAPAPFVLRPSSGGTREVVLPTRTSAFPSDLLVHQLLVEPIAMPNVPIVNRKS